MNVTVIREPNPLTQREWRFWYYERCHALVLDFYATRERASKRHKFQMTEGYNRIGRNSLMKESDVLLPADVRDEAVTTFINQLKVRRWEETKNSSD